MTAKEYQEMIKNLQKKKESKYHSNKTKVNGIMFDSKKEANYYSSLMLLVRTGEIHDLELQVPFLLAPAMYVECKYGNNKKYCVHREYKYIADFTYTTKEGEYVVVDVKGFRTAEYKKKKNLMKRIYGIEIKEV